MQSLPSYVSGAAVSHAKINWRNDKWYFALYRIFGLLKSRLQLNYEATIFSVHLV